MESTNVVSVIAEKANVSLAEIQAVGLEYGAKILLALVIFFVGMWVAKGLKKGIETGMERQNVDPTLIKFLTSLIYVGLQAFVIVAALGQLGIQTASFIAVLGAAGLAVGLALQGSLSNFASGVLMIVFKPFVVGDFVEAGGVTGMVDEINIFTTQIDTPDNKKIIVPNAHVMGGNIINFNTNGSRRVDLVAGIGYGDDIDQAKAAVESIFAADPRILKDPAPTVGVLEMADSSVNLVVRPWCTGDDYWAVYFDTTESIKKKFDEEGISIPFPQRDVHLYEHKGE